MLKRRQLFEFCDQPWLKGTLRDGYFDCLSFLHHVYQPYYRLIGPIAEWANGEPVLDLASGSGEQIAMLIDMGKTQDLILPRFVLSDLYPQPVAWRNLQQEFGEKAVEFIERPVSAFNMQGIDIHRWSIFTAFHHFAPDAGRRLLEEVIRESDGLCILEVTQRRWQNLALMLVLLPFQIMMNMLTPIFAKEFTLGKLLFTTFLPIISLMVAFDGVVSTLRSYTRDEIIAMLPPGCQQHFTIEYREFPFRRRFLPFFKATMFALSRESSS